MVGPRAEPFANGECWEFARKGKCPKGKNCKYSHGKESKPAQAPKKPCNHFFTYGNCRFGDSCRYSHDSDTPGASKLIASDRKEVDELLKRWRFNLPKSGARAVRPLDTKGLSNFFEQALHLVDSGGDTMQTVVTSLASAEGLVRVRELVSREWETTNDSTLLQLMPPLLLYFRVLSHQTVRQSTVVEVRHGTLLNDLYGVAGQRAIPLFKAVIRYLADNSDTPSSPRNDDVEMVLAAFACMLEKNDATAIANPELKAIADVMLSLLDMTAIDRSTERHVRTICAKLDLGEKLPHANRQSGPSRPAGPRATFTIVQDLPGTLSDFGPRHDNDHSDIQDISILPTMGEIVSGRSEYLPREDPSEWHLPGLSGLIDRQFRLVREDTVGQLRDAARFELERIRNPRVERRQGVRTNVYHNVHLQNVSFDARRGLLFALSFDQPHHLTGKLDKQRRLWWDESLRLAPDSLICMLSADGNATFLVVHSPNTYSRGKEEGQSRKMPIHEQYNLHLDPSRATVIAELTSSVPEQASALLKSCITSNIPKILGGPPQGLLIEFPGVVLPAFGPTLTALQTMAASHDVPFSDLLVPGWRSEAGPPPPAYSQKHGFLWNLECLLPRDGHSVSPVTNAKIAATLESTSLDEAQREAVQHALSHSVALIQGPPGTGKSYTGVKLIQALLQNKSAATLGPIICVCYTNHALDQLLEHLLDAGVTQIVRLGSRSKSERLANVNIRKLAQSERFTKQEGQEYGQAKDSIESTGQEIQELLSQLSSAHTDDSILNFLCAEHPLFFQQFKPAIYDEEGFQIVGAPKASSTLSQWLAGGIAPPYNGAAQPRPLGLLKTGNIPLAHMTAPERALLYNDWVSSATAEFYEELEVQLDSFSKQKDIVESIRGDQDLRVLAGANVIGLTTTGLARSIKHLRKINAKVLVVEEAGEVLEAHLLTAMLPSLEHAILVGDHQQLRPKIQNYELSAENQRSDIALDVSLFERLVDPRSPGSTAMPYVALETQRRMHPSISRLVRETLYPSLMDAPSVTGYPEVHGMRHRLFWLDHQHKEDGKNEHLHSTSHTNTFEVDMVVALVRHLQRQGIYASSDIAVLTPYLGQLRKLRQKLASLVGIILDDRDADELAREDITQGTDATADASEDASRRPLVVKGNLLNAVRLATVDNFQGEEAKVVIISLVRCNDQFKCGFLRTSNRINVLLSRAQHGMYIIGNAATTSSVPMWQDVLNILKSDNKTGSALELSCARHPEMPLKVSEPDDFQNVAPEAGCNLMCGKQLPCGHACPTKCHSDVLHNDVHCLKDCARPKRGCEHPCRRVCGDPCGEKCMEIVQCDVQLPCGHRVTQLPCWLYQDKTLIQCEVPMERTVSSCGHKVTVACRVSVEASTFVCRESCSTALECGHTCNRSCFQCRPRDEQGATTEVNHGQCRKVCGRGFTSCEHSCRKLCHPGKDCALCDAKCGVACAHFPESCAKKCSEPCVPCAEEQCPSQCPHSACRMPCAAPCDWVPCSLRCTKKLPCGHQCPSLCGEACPPSEMCQICATEETKAIRADLLTLEDYGEIDLNNSPCLFLPCGHIFTFDSLDGVLEMGLHYVTDEEAHPIALKGSSEPFSVKKMKACPDCRGSLRSVARYGRIVRRALLDINTKKFIAWSNRAYLPLAEQLQTEQANLKNNRSSAKLLLSHISMRTGPGALNQMLKSVGSRYKSALKLLRDIKVFLSKVRREEQPYQKVRNLVEAARRRQREEAGTDLPEFHFDETILLTRGQLLARALEIRCELIMITDLVSVWENAPYEERNSTKLALDFEPQRAQCDLLLQAAQDSMNVLQQAEGNIFWAEFAAVEAAAATSEGSSEDRLRTIEILKEEAHRRLDQAQDVCDRCPSQTASVADEVNGVREMLSENGGISSSEMRMVVAAMEREFSGTGHWYRCANGHPFTVGECGGPMERSTCPQCGAPIGGQHHRAAEGVTHARDIEQEFSRMRV